MTIKRRALERSPIPPSIHIRRDVLDEYGITQEELAEALGVSRLTVNQLCNNKRSITAEMALRLEHVSGVAAVHWMELQTNYDLWWARQKAGTKLDALARLARRRGSRAESRSGTEANDER